MDMHLGLLLASSAGRHPGQRIAEGHKHFSVFFSLLIAVQVFKKATSSSQKCFSIIFGSLSLWTFVIDYKLLHLNCLVASE